MSSPFYSEEPDHKEEFTREMNAFYSRFSGVYDFLVKTFPVWKRWMTQALPHICGPRILEISFGTGYLLTRYADLGQVFGFDYNEQMARTAVKNLRGKNRHAFLHVGDVHNIPYPGNCFDTIVNTMAFSGYPDGETAMLEMDRVLKPGGRLILIDVANPGSGNLPGRLMVRFWAALGDIIRDLDAVFEAHGFTYTSREIGGFGSVHLYLAEKKRAAGTSGD